MTGTWRITHVLVLIAVILFALAFIAAMGWTGNITNAPAWATAGLAVFAASFLPWRTAP